MDKTVNKNRCILFDWGDTLMRVFPGFAGPMFKWPHVEAVSFAEEVLPLLHKQWIIAMATNAIASKETDIRAALLRVNLSDYIDKVYCFQMIGHRKPAPVFFKFILNDLKVDYSDVFMVGDNFQEDVLGANRCGIRAVWFNEHSDDIHTGEMHRTIHTLKSLPEILHDFGK